MTQKRQASSLSRARAHKQSLVIERSWLRQATATILTGLGECKYPTASTSRIVSFSLLRSMRAQRTGLTEAMHEDELVNAMGIVNPLLIAFRDLGVVRTKELA